MDVGTVIIFLACIFAMCLEAILDYRNTKNK